MKQRGGFFGSRLGFFGDGKRTQLFNVIDSGSIGEFNTSLDTVLEKHTDINTITNKDGMHLLTYACTKGRLDIVKVLQSKGVDFSIVDFRETVRDFYQRQFPSFIFVNGKGSPLLEAILSNNRELVQYLLTLRNVSFYVRHFIYPNSEKSWYNRIESKQGGPLELALAVNPEIFEDLLAYYTDRKINGGSPIEEYNNLLSECIPVACSRSSPELLEKLFKAGAKLQTKRIEDVSELPDSSVAEMFMNHPDIDLQKKIGMLRTLIAYGLDVNYVSRQKKSLLQTTFDESGVNTEMAKILIDNGATKESLGSNADDKLRKAGLMEYYETSLRARQVNPATMHSHSTMAGLGQLAPQKAGKRTRRRGRGRGRRRGRKTRSRA
jgi:ankyrin repeat protein